MSMRKCDDCGLEWDYPEEGGTYCEECGGFSSYIEEEPEGDVHDEHWYD